MGIDRGAGEEPDPRSGPSPSSADAPHPAEGRTSTGTSQSGTSQPSPEQPDAQPPASAPEYDYGTPETAEPSAGGTAADPATGRSPASERHPETGLRPGTAPRAVLRPVPEGFPTPPPRPGRPNRRPAPSGDAEQPSRSRPAMIISLVVVAVLVLVVAIGGSIIAYRALSPDPSDAASPAATAEADEDEDEDEGAAGEVAIADVTVQEVSTEIGVREVGGPGAGALEPEGEFVVVTVEVANDSDIAVSIAGHETLRTADGETYEPDSEASREHVAESKAFGQITPGESGTFHLVYDVSVGAEPTELELDFSENAAVGTGVLPLGG
ncbi:MAG: DUF4352 domain-containing protein [Brachybacterium sp.]|uniref:DUF4352 domain-containing protein n=1 Tax=Brachybacterium sp. TaxID=1891286 RepID=UPI0026489707|nr:DUF4352 domain-containing protein [Brachybacterium sp.]MDN5686167.1 DUF4352 domain-containing protein [Brachybacterium sp.]